MPPTEHCDVAIVGGGLAGGLIAHALTRRRPELSVRLVERGALGGNHVWSFFSDDVAAADRWIIEPFVSRGWQGYDVAFPRLRRHFDARYNSVLSADFAARLGDLLPPGAVVAAAATLVEPRAVTLAGGGRIEARGVIDARGPAELSHLVVGWQKFLGQEIRVEGGHGLAEPVVMDATVDQADGYRFVYLLPFAPDRLLVEDTYYSDDPGLELGDLRDRIAAYVASRGWRVAEIEREETGVLPVAIGGDPEAYWRSGGEGVAKAGMRAGLFHPMTGYSLPDAVRAAGLVAGAADHDGEALHRLLHDHAIGLWRARGFYRLLGRMLFRAAGPVERYRVLQRFYGLAPALIGRFYAARSTPFDKFRVLAGWPPVPISRALRVLKEPTA